VREYPIFVLTPTEIIDLVLLQPSLEVLIDNKLMNLNDMPQLMTRFFNIVEMKDTIVITEVVIILWIHHTLKNSE
jgi:hypothetical protein